jgi:hypothetical protein
MNRQQCGEDCDATRHVFQLRISSGSRVGCNLAGDTPAATAKINQLIAVTVNPSSQVMEREQVSQN